VWSNRYVQGQGWEGAVVLENGSTEAFGSSIAMDPKGTATVIWRQRDNNSNAWNVMTTRYVPGTGWVQPPALIENMPGDAQGWRDVAMDDIPDNEVGAVAIWVQEDGGVNSVFINTFIQGQGWPQSASLLETSNADAKGSQLDIDPSGNVTAVWIQRDANDTRWDLWANVYN